MGINDQFEKKAVTHKEWSKIREELRPTENNDDIVTFTFNNSKIIKKSGISSAEANRRHTIYSELCWYINQGQGYCETAPEYIKVYLRRLNLI